MDELKLVGMRSGEFTDKNGTLIAFYQWHVIRPADSQRGEQGQIVDILKVMPDAYANTPEIGTFFIPFYNKYGRVIGFQPTRK